MSKNLLQVSDVFQVPKGMDVYTDVPEKFVYSNRKTSNENTNYQVTAGVDLIVYSSDQEQEMLAHAKKIASIADYISEEAALEFIKSLIQVDSVCFNAQEMVGEYVVTATSMTGGGSQSSMSGVQDVYPEVIRSPQKSLNQTDLMIHQE